MTARHLSAPVALAVSAALFTGVATVDTLTRDQALSRLALPASGEVMLETLPDGRPVFVVAHADETASVLSAVAPHSGEPLAWCARAGIFVEPVGASRFDARGRYAFGPAPVGVPAFDARVVGDEVVVSDDVRAPPRWQHAELADDIAYDADPCVPSEGAIASLTADWDDLPGPFAPSRIPRKPGVYQVAARVEVPLHGHARLCPLDSTTCRDPVSVRRGSLNTPGSGWEGFSFTRTGVILVRRTRTGALVDLVTPFTTTTSDVARSVAEPDVPVVAALLAVQPVGGGWRIDVSAPNPPTAAPSTCAEDAIPQPPARASYNLARDVAIRTFGLPIQDPVLDGYPISAAELRALSHRHPGLVALLCVRQETVESIELLSASAAAASSS
jgi:hypothetical protein